LRKSPARVAIHLNIENPAPVFNTNRAITCWRNSPTMTVGLGKNQWGLHNRLIGNRPRHLASIPRRSPKSKLEDKKTKHADCAISKCGTLSC
jgi:hypothetical protein